MMKAARKSKAGKSNIKMTSTHAKNGSHPTLASNRKDAASSNVLKSICNVWAYVYVLAMMLGLPLYYENQYFNMLQAKSHYFVYAGGALLGIGLILYVIAYWRDIPKTIVTSPLDIAVIGFAVVAVISCLASKSPEESFWGSQGWCIGAYAWICLALSYLLVSRCIHYREWLWYPVMFVNAVMIFLGILHAAGIDVLGMHQHMYENQILDYYSTFGQMNWWVPYLCLFTPLTAVFVTLCKDLAKRIVLYIFWAFICMGILISASDGLFVGLGLCMFFAVPFVMKSASRVERAGILISIYGVCSLIFSLMPCFGPRIAKINKGIFKLLTTPGICAAFIAAGIICCLLTRLLKKSLPKDAAFRKQFQFWIIILMEAVIAAIAIYYVVTTIRDFNDSWGSRRGVIWRMSADLLKKFDTKHMVLGYGPEMLRDNYAAITAEFDRSVLVSHSEPLQYLLTTGIAGLVFWLGIWGSSIFMYLRSHKSQGLSTAAAFGKGKTASRFTRKSQSSSSNNYFANAHSSGKAGDSPSACFASISDFRDSSAAFFLPLIAYLGQSFVNSAMTTNLVMLFIFLAFFYVASKTSSRPHTK